MGGGGEKTYTTSVSGLADSQYAGLQSGQDAIRSDMSSFANSAAAADAKITNTLDTGFNNVNTGLNNLSGKVGEVNTNVTTGFNNFGNKLDAMSSSVGTKLDGIGSGVTAGFAGMNTALANTSNQLKTDMNSGFTTLYNQNNDNSKVLYDTTTKGFTDANANMAKGFNDTNANVNAKFDAQGNQITTGFAGTKENIDATRTALATGQADIRSLVEKYGGNLDKYYADLAAGQADTTGRLGTLQTGMDTFRTDFQKSDQLANQQRARMADQIVGGFDAVRNDVGNQGNVAANAANALSNQVRGVGSQIEQSGQQTDIKFGNIARDIQAGVQAGDNNSQQLRNAFVDRLNEVRRTLTDQTANLDETTRQQYMELSQSFDENGQLITQSVDQQGLKINRAIDGQGNLLVTKFDQNNQLVSQSALNMDKLLNGVGQDVEQVNKQIGGVASTVGNVNNQVGGLASQIGALSQGQEKNFALIAKQVATGFSDGTRETAAAQKEFTTNINSIKSLVSNQNLQVNDQIRQEFTDLSSSFDETGKLISRSVDQQGVTTARAIDNQGRLLLARFDQNGKQIDQQALDLNRMMKALSSSGFIAGSNSSAGTGTPTSVAGQYVSAPNAPQYTGLMTPYAMSMG